MSEETILYCNPSAGQRTLELWLGSSNGATVRSAEYDDLQAEDVLQSISTLLDDYIPSHIVIVNTAQSFTAIRILITICNTMALAWGCRLHETNQPVESMEEIRNHLVGQQRYLTPRYTHEPNIS